MNIKVDFNDICGKIKPMHAVNNVPELPRADGKLTQKLGDAHVPYVRLHDTGGGFGGSRYVDIANVFPNFDADENDPNSYDFAFTDVLLNGIIGNGMKPFYRLGATIENYCDIKAYNIYPPKDNEKWARICEHIIMHYNEGWADGFHMDIEHWEIWNEPDNYPDIEDNQMWKGTMEEYFELYKVASTHLKKRFPNLKIGGYSSCGFYALSQTDVSAAAHSTSRVDYFIDFFIAFLEFIKKNSLPLDFFSWHSYAGVDKNVMYAAYAREKLDEYGYNDSEVYFNEWNPGTADRGTQKDASNILSMMCAMHNTPTDMCMYYNLGIISGYCGVFNPISRDIFNAYYAFYDFGKLYSLKNQVKCSVEGEDIYALAAKSEGEKGIVIVNNRNEKVSAHLDISGADLKTAKAYVTDDKHSHEEVKADLPEVDIQPYGIIYIGFDK